MRIDDFTLEKYKSGELLNTVPCLKMLKKVIENDSVHNNDSVYNHTLNVAENVLTIAESSSLFAGFFNRLVKNNSVLDLVTTAALFHDVGKASAFTVSEGVTSCEGHEKISFEIVRDFFKNIDGDPEEKQVIIEIVRQHAVFYPYLDPANKKIDRDFNTIKNENKLYPELILFCASDIRGSQLKENDPQSYSFKDRYLLLNLEKYITVYGR